MGFESVNNLGKTIWGFSNCFDGDIEYTLTMGTVTGGSATPAGTNQYSPATVVPIEATADANYEFVAWTGDTANITNTTDPTTDITMLSSAQIAPSFILTPAAYSPLIWLDASQGITQGGGGAVSAWTDRSGNSNNFSQASGSLQPTYQATGLNSAPTVYFDGSEEMECGTLSATLAACTIFLVAVETVTEINGQTLLGSKSGSNNKRVWTSDEGLERVVYRDGGATEASTSTLTPTTTPFAVAVRERADKNTDLRINNEAWSTPIAINTVTSNTQGLKIGNWGTGTPRYFNGKISHVIVYNSVLTDVQVDNVMNYLNYRYSIW